MAHQTSGSFAKCTHCNWTTSALRDDINGGFCKLCRDYRMEISNEDLSRAQRVRAAWSYNQARARPGSSVMKRFAAYNASVHYMRGSNILSTFLNKGIDATVDQQSNQDAKCAQADSSHAGTFYDSQGIAITAWQ